MLMMLIRLPFLFSVETLQEKFPSLTVYSKSGIDKDLVSLSRLVHGSTVVIYNIGPGWGLIIDS